MPKHDDYYSGTDAANEKAEAAFWRGESSRIATQNAAELEAGQKFVRDWKDRHNDLREPSGSLSFVHGVGDLFYAAGQASLAYDGEARSAFTMGIRSGFRERTRDTPAKI